MLLLGIDLGTTNCKIALYDENQKTIDRVQFGTPTIFLESGWVEYDIEMLWTQLSQYISKMMKFDYRGEKIKGIAISSQGESGLLVDIEMRPLMNAIAWYDSRTQGIMEEWKTKIDKEELYEITGLELNYIHSILKIQWVKENRPEIYNKASKWHCLSDYVMLKICGTGVMDYSLASRTMAFDIQKKEWSRRILDIAGVSSSLLPKVLPAGRLVDVIREDIAQEWGITSQAVIATGGFDHMCGCLGVGANTSMQVVDSIGTTESVCLYRNQMDFSSKNGYTWGCHVFPNIYYQLGGMPSGGNTIEWAIKVLLKRDISDESFEEFLCESEKSTAGSGGVIFLPHLNGCVTPIVDPNSKGGFWGITTKTTTSDLCRAVIEGLCYEFKWVLESAAGDIIQNVVAMGGGARNRIWMQYKADILNVPVETKDIEDAVTLGAALLAGKAAGLYDDTAFQFLQFTTKEIYYPNEENHKIYQNIYENTYKKLYYSQHHILR